MKNVARAIVAIIALTGAASAAHTTAASLQSTSPRLDTRAAAFPIPTCPLDDPNACGIGGPNVVRK